MTRDETLYLLRRQCGGAGGAEKVVRRFGRVLQEGGEVRVLSAGDRVDGVRIGGGSGPSWWRALSYSASVDHLLERCGAVRILSFERGPRCEIYRAGDGVHRRWVRLKYGSSPRWRFNPYHWVVPRLERCTMESATAIVANSKMVARDVEEYYPEFAGKVRVIYNGFEPAVYHPAKGDAAALRTELGIPAEGRMLLFVGSGWERKGLAEAIAFLGRCGAEKDSRLVVVGKGRPANYETLVDELGLRGRVHFTGVVEKPAPYFQAADLHILPTSYDPFSNSCLEALACGCPVLTTRGNGAAEVIEAGLTGFVLEDPGDEKSWKEADSWWAGFSGDRAAIAGSVAGYTSDAELDRYRALLYPEAKRDSDGG